MAKRKRDVPVLFWVSAEELELIHQKMQQYGTENLSAYLRKMALDGYVVKLDLPELKELVSLMRRSSNNLNQLTRKVHETGRVYDADLEDISQRQCPIKKVLIKKKRNHTFLCMSLRKTNRQTLYDKIKELIHHTNITSFHENMPK